MHLSTGLNFNDWPPAIGAVLLNRRLEHMINWQLQMISKHYIVRINAVLGCTKEAIRIEMLIYA